MEMGIVLKLGIDYRRVLGRTYNEVRSRPLYTISGSWIGQNLVEFPRPSYDWLQKGDS
jgi:hypothetical protein